MTAWIVAHEAVLRVSAFVATFALIAIAETMMEARPLRASRRRRWTSNIGLAVLNTFILRLLFPAGATAAALWAARHGLGLFRQVTLPVLAELVLSILLLDLAIYTQHRVFHSVPQLFRFHQVHHADVDFDVTLGSRFHPIEMVLSMAIKIGAVIALGASASAVVIFELLLAVSALFSHGNVRLPLSVDGVLRWLVVTPGMHIVHHSAERADRDSNYGFCIPWWDRLFRTYRERSDLEQPAIGMPEHQSTVVQPMRWLLALPFRSERAPQRSSTNARQEAV